MTQSDQAVAGIRVASVDRSRLDEALEAARSVLQESARAVTRACERQHGLERALSKSGRTAEVVTFARMLRRRGVPVIAMTGCGGTSELCAVADTVVDACVERECDPWDLVPTASTTVSLVVGDALAVALMVARNFGPHDFRSHHPGGTLGEGVATPALGSP